MNGRKDAFPKLAPSEAREEGVIPAAHRVNYSTQEGLSSWQERKEFNKLPVRTHVSEIMAPFLSMGRSESRGKLQGI